MYSVKVGVWIEASIEQIWSALWTKDGFVDLLPHVHSAKALDSKTWVWQLGMGSTGGSSTVVCVGQPCSRLTWHSVDGLPTAGQIRLDYHHHLTYLEVKLKTFPVWSLGQLLSDSGSPAAVLNRRLQEFASQLEATQQVALGFRPNQGVHLSKHIPQQSRKNAERLMENAK